MKIYLKQLSLRNFKGVREKTINFHHETFIFGRNEAGKTTLMDAFLWLLFGKDSSDRSDSSFEIKTLDENNNPFRKLTHEVIAQIDVDDEPISLRKVYKEKWVKKKGNATEEFAGHEKEHFWNDVPMKESDYQKAISKIVDEQLFKLITNTNYFSALKWQDRRNVLLQMAGTISTREVLDLITTPGNKTEMAALTTALNQKKTIDQYRAEVGSKKKMIKEEIILLPSRIDEAKRSLPEIVNEAELAKKIEAANMRIDAIDAALQNKNASQKAHIDAISKLITERQELNQKLMQIEFEERNKTQDSKRERESVINELKRELQGFNNELFNIRRDRKFNEGRKAQLSAEQVSLRNKWSEVNGEQLKFWEDAFACPTCKRAFEDDDIESKKAEALKNFNTDKAKRLAAVSEKGKHIGNEVKELDVQVESLELKEKEAEQSIAVLQAKIAELEEAHIQLSNNDLQQVQRAISENKEHAQILTKVSDLTKKIDAPNPEVDNTELNEEKRSLRNEIDEWKRELASVDIRNKVLARIEDLTKQESAMANELAALEAIEFCIEQFRKAEMDELERRVNKRFDLVRFKMFEEQINGGTKETCVTLVKGVPYPDVNTAGKIQAGLDIINTLSKHYDVVAPVWVDNRESVTTLPPTKCQLISLVVSPSDKTLRVETKEMEEVA